MSDKTAYSVLVHKMGKYWGKMQMLNKDRMLEENKAGRLAGHGILTVL